MTPYFKTLAFSTLLMTSLAFASTASVVAKHEYRAARAGLRVTDTPSSLPKVGASTSSLSFSSQVEGTTSEAQSFVVYNAGTVPLGLGGLYATKPFVVGSSCVDTLAPGAQCAVSVQFAPQSSGATAGTVHLDTDAGPVEVSLSGTGLSSLSAALSSELSAVSTPSGAFADTAVDSARQMTFFVKNTGESGALSVSASLADAHDFQFISAQKANASGGTYAGTSCGASVSAAALANCQADPAGGSYPDIAVTVKFAPKSEGVKESAVTVTHNGSNTSPLVLPLSGRGVGTPTADVSANTLVWSAAVHATDVGSSSAASVRLTNNGTTALSITGPVQVTGSPTFAASSNCPTSLPMGGYCDATVIFSPTTTATQSGTLTFSTSAGSPAVALSGTGLQAAGALTADTSSDFGTIPLTGSSSRSFTFQNTGNKAATGVYASVPVSGVLTLSSNTCGTQAAKVSVPAGSSCSFTAAWTASTASNLADTLVVTGSFSGNPASVAVTGTVASANYTTLSAGGWDIASPLARYSYPNTVLVCGQNIGGKTGWRVPTQAEFESLRTTANIAGAGWPSGANDYYWTSTPYIAGTHVVRLAVASGSYALDSDLYYAACVRPYAAGFLTAVTDANFGSVTVTTSNEKTFTFSSGPVALSSIAPTVSGSADLSIKSTTCGSTLAANSSCSVVVSYAPSAVSTLSNAKLTVSSNAENSPANVTLSGSGVPDTSVVSLLHFDGTNGATVVSDSTSGTNWTNTGVTLTTANKKFGSSAGNFNASSYAVSTQTVALGTNAFTAEAWFYPTRVVAYEYLFGQLIPNNNSTWWVGLYNGKPTVGAWNGVSWSVQGASSVILNTWNHVALVRSGTELRLYLNGALVSSSTNGVPTFATNKISVGIPGPTWTDAPFLGVIDELRISNGTARYSGSTYTLPSAPF